MISEKMNKALNGQVNAEMYSSYLYLAMAAKFDSVNLDGFGQWMRIQAQEELYHAMKLFDYVLERGGEIELTEIEKPKAKWKTPLEMFEAAYEHEQLVTSLINGLVDVAQAERDHAANSFLQWYVDEQVEEESTAEGVVEKLKLIGEDKGALMIYDRDMGQRVPLFTFPVKEE